MMKRRDLLKSLPVTDAVRLANAVQELKQAMHEFYGVWPDDLSQLIKGKGVVVLAALPHPMERAWWTIEDGSPLVGSEQEWADWQAEYDRLNPGIGGRGAA